jgi:hypothetical protein
MRVNNWSNQMTSFTFQSFLVKAFLSNSFQATEDELCQADACCIKIE